MKSDKPFHRTMESLLEIADIGQRELGRRAESHGWTYTFSHLNRYLTGESKVTPQVIEVLAETLQVPPETFAEYRLWKARSPYDPDTVGFKVAVRNLHRLEAAEDEAGPHDPHKLADRLHHQGNDEDQAASS
jgi:transcriptional regulator with XRE-family HTH domain